MAPETRSYRMDGRAQDVVETRRRILDVARELFLQQPFVDVTLQAIADGAQVTRQTVLNHYESKGGVFLAAAQTIVGDRHNAAPGDIEGALDELVAEYERYGDALMRLIEVEERFPVVHTQVERGRAGHRAWVETVFQDRITPDGPGRTVEVFALTTATDLYVWKLLRRDHGLDVASTREAIGTLVTGALVPVQDPPGGSA